MCFLMFVSLLKVFFQVLFGWGGFGGDENVIHIASMPKTRVFTVFSSLCTTHCAKYVEQDTLSQVSSMTKTLVFAVLLASLYNMLHKDVERRKLSQVSMPLATCPKRCCFCEGCGLRTPDEQAQSQKPKNNVTKSEIFSLVQ